MRRSIVIAVGWPYPGWQGWSSGEPRARQRPRGFGQLDQGLKREARQNQRLGRIDHDLARTQRLGRDMRKMQAKGGAPMDRTAPKRP